jgi:hypothetical protein
LCGCFGPADESSGLGSAGELGRFIERAPPIAVSFAAAASSTARRRSSAAWSVVLTIIGPRMPLTS